MKKIIGSLLLIISFITVVVSSVAATKIDGEKEKLWANALKTFDPALKFRLDREQNIAIFFFCLAIVMFVVGLVMVLSKSKKQ